MHKTKYNSFDMEISLLPKSPLLVKAGGISANPSLPDMQFIRTETVEKGEIVYIPGASIKGVVRSYVEKILRTKSEELACNIVGETSCTKTIENNEKMENRDYSSHEIYKNSCSVCKVFGNGKLKSRISFLDAYPEGEIKTEIRHGVAISRLTHAVAAGPFDMEVLVKGNFKTRLHLENFECWQLGLIALAFQGLNNGLIRVGFGKNRGFGEIEANIDKMTFSFSKNIPKNEIWGIGTFSGDDRNSYGITENDLIQIEAEPFNEYEKAFYQIREYPSENWTEISSQVISKLQEVLG